MTSNTYTVTIFFYRNGEITKLVFQKDFKGTQKRKRINRKEHRDDYLPFGGFEKHTKGVGSKILKR